MANDESIRITNAGSSELVIKKSRFLGMAESVSTEEDARELIAAVRKEHYTARHVCYAYILDEDIPVIKYSDDGEPGGTAGRPILDTIKGSGISNVIVIVVRYFGGVLLGTGGLVRAYTEAAQEALANADTKTICLSNFYDITLEYADADKIKYILDNTDEVICSIDYSDKVLMHVTVPERTADMLIRQISEKTAGRAEIKYLKTIKI